MSNAKIRYFSMLIIEKMYKNGTYEKNVTAIADKQVIIMSSVTFRKLYDDLTSINLLNSLILT